MLKSLSFSCNVKSRSCSRFLRGRALTNVQKTLIAQRVCSLEFGFSRFGSAYHDRECQHIRPLQSRTAEFARACSVCVHKAVRGVL